MEPRKKILVIRFKAIGDVVLTLPAVQALRDNFPGAHITFFTIIENAPLLQGFREVDEVIALDRAALRGGNPFRIALEFFRLLRRLRAGKFSLIVDLQGYGETAWLTRLTGAPQRWGSVYGRGRSWAYTRGVRRREDLHPVSGMFFLLRECGLKIGATRNEFCLPEQPLGEARKIFAGHGLDIARPTLFIQPFTSSSFKNWPLENYLAVARHWRARGMQVVFGGGPADLPALEPARTENFPVFAGVPLLVTAGLLQYSTFILGGDTGMLHLAVALGKPVLMLMHKVLSGSPVPFQHPDWVIAAPAPVPIAEIPVAAVNDAIAVRWPHA